MPTTSSSGNDPQETSGHPRFPRQRTEIDPASLNAIHDGHVQDEDDEESGGAFFFRGLLVALVVGALTYAAVWAALRWL